MTCELAREKLMEGAREAGFGGAADGAGDEALATHLASCEACRARRDAQGDLTSYLAALRSATREADTSGDSAWTRAVLMREFDAQRRRERQVRRMWAMATAAILALSVVTVRDMWMRPPAGQILSNGAGVVHAREYAPRAYPEETFVPAEEAGEEGFIKVPFALPPVPGETFGIVRGIQLEPAQLARMGVSVDPAWSGTTQADVLVGEDGLAQAVRLSDDDASSSGVEAGGN